VACLLRHGVLQPDHPAHVHSRFQLHSIRHTSRQEI